MKTIEVVVAPTGGIKIEAMGFVGADCEKATAYLEQALGVVGTRQKKPEYHQCNTLKHKLRLGQ